MTDRITAELIAEAKSRAELCDADTREAMRDTGRIILRLVDALETMRIERDIWQLSAEEAERAEKRAEEAAAWGEGHDAGWEIAARIREQGS